MAINRRQFLERAGWALGALALSQHVNVAADPNGIPVGLQLYTVRDHLEKDLEGTFKRVREIGYTVVELGGTFDFYGRKPGELKRMLNDAGLQPLSTHFNQQQLKTDLPKHIADAKECGVSYLGLSSLDHQDRKSLDAIKRDADWFNKAGEAATKAGCHFFYHGHNFDFATVDGVVEYDELIRRFIIETGRTVWHTWAPKVALSAITPSLMNLPAPRWASRCLCLGNAPSFSAYRVRSRFLTISPDDTIPSRATATTTSRVSSRSTATALKHTAIARRLLTLWAAG